MQQFEVMNDPFNVFYWRIACVTFYPPKGQKFTNGENQGITDVFFQIAGKHVISDKHFKIETLILLNFKKNSETREGVGNALVCPTNVVCLTLEGSQKKCFKGLNNHMMFQIFELLHDHSLHNPCLKHCVLYHPLSL